MTEEHNAAMLQRLAIVKGTARHLIEHIQVRIAIHKIMFVDGTKVDCD
jgi:hypothetical protein